MAAVTVAHLFMTSLYILLRIFHPYIEGTTKNTEITRFLLIFFFFLHFSNPPPFLVSSQFLSTSEAGGKTDVLFRSNKNIKESENFVLDGVTNSNDNFFELSNSLPNTSVCHPFFWFRS